MNKDFGFREEDGYRGATEIRIFKKRAAHSQADIALQLAERWGMVAGVTDGEDSAGRSKVRLATPDEIVERACDTADKLVMEFELRGWFTELPEPKPVDKQRKE